MANHCEKLVKKLTDKFFKVSAIDSSSVKTSKIITSLFNINFFRKRKSFRNQIGRVTIFISLIIYLKFPQK